MRAPALASPGVALRLSPVSGDSLFDEEAYLQGMANLWSSLASLLRRMLAAQPSADYESYGFHATALERAEAMARYLRGESAEAPNIEIGDVFEALSDFGPEGHRFCRHPNHPHTYGWFPLVPRRAPRSGHDVAARMRLMQRLEALADQDAELPPVVDGTPALPTPTPPETETPERRLARLKRELALHAVVHYDTPPAQLPQSVIDILIAIADACDGDMTQALQAWHEACAIVGEE